MFSKNAVSNKIIFLREQPEIIRLTFLYRYVSLSFTSFFYLIGNSGHPIGRKLFIIFCLLISAAILSNLYIKNKGITKNIILLIIIETIGNALLLIPSGGIESPYVWYSLNTILIASVELNRIYTWTNLFIYLVATTWISKLVLRSEEYSFIELIYKQSNPALSLILITIAMQLLSKYAKDIESESKNLEKLNNQLGLANERIKRSMNYIMELYQTIQLISIQSDKRSLYKLIIQYAKKITMSDTSLFYSKLEEVDELIIDTNVDFDNLKEKLNIKLSELDMNVIDFEMPFELKIEDKKFIMFFVKSNYITYGILGIEMAEEADSTYQEAVELLRILSGLSSIVMQKIELEQVNTNMVITAEQNRIASEIHDSILQRLFSISCGLFALIRSQKEFKEETIKEELSVIRVSINNIMKDLRSTIYDLSWKKTGNDNFIADLENRIKEVSKLNDIKIKFEVKGTSELLSLMHKKAVYRIIYEGIGNAVCHGKANQIKVLLDIQATHTILKIIDNGSGFNLTKVKTEHREGLGIRNINQLAYALNGNIQFNSEIGNGTEIEVVFPNHFQSFKGEVV